MQAVKAYDGVDVWRHSFLTSALGGSVWLALGFGRFNQEERDFVIHWIWGCLDTWDTWDTWDTKLCSIVLKGDTAGSVKSAYICLSTRRW